MKWVTRKNAKVDRIACPWLITRFVDPDAEFLYVEAASVMETAERENAIPYDVEEAKLGHVDGRCSFESIIASYNLTDPALNLLGRIVHGADIAGDRDLVPEIPLRAAQAEILVHGHCQQKALVGAEGSVAALRRVEGFRVRELDSGCCGMAGSFGYELGHRTVSEALANRVILPSLAAEPNATLAAPGFSCRSQVHGLAGILAKHPVELLADLILDAPSTIKR